MSITVSQLIGLVTIRGVESSIVGLERVGGATDLAGAKLGLLAVGATVVAGVALAAFGAKVASMAGDFEQATETLVTGAGEQQAALGKVRQGILSVAVDTATPTKNLIDAMFLIESAGYRGAAGLTVLKDAAEEARVGNADLGKVADVLTTVLHNYHLSVADAVPVLNSFNRTVADGKMYLDDLNAALTNVLPAASAAHVSLSDVEGALAAMSLAGDKGASAGTHLSQMFLSLEKPTSAATKVLRSIGLTTQGISTEMQKSLPDAIQMIYDALAKKFPPGSAAFNAAAATIVGGTRQMKAWNELTGQSFDDLKSKTADIAGSMQKSGQAVTGWDKVQGEFNFKIAKAGEVLETMGIKVGTLLLPILGRLADWFTGTAAPALTRFGNWIMNVGIPALRAFGDWIRTHVITAAQAMSTFFQSHILPVLQMIGSFLATTFAPLWKQLVAVWQSQILPSLKQLWDALTPLLPVLKMIGGIILGVVIVAIGLFIGVLGGLLKALSGLLQGVATVIGGMVRFFTGGIQIISGLIKFFVDLATGNFKNLGNDLHSIWNGIVNMFRGVWEVIKGIFQGAWNAISGFVSGLITGVIGFFGHLKDMLVGHSIVPDIVNGILRWFGQLPGKLFGLAVQMVQGLINGIGSMAGGFASALGNMVHNAVGNIPGLGGILSGLHILGYQHGGPVMQTGLAMVHKGEFVVPAGGWHGGYSGGSSSASTAALQPINLYIDGYRLATVLLPHQVTAIRNHVGIVNL